MTGYYHPIIQISIWKKKLILWAFFSHCVQLMSCITRSLLPMMSSAVLTAFWRALWLWAEQLPYHIVMQPVRMLSMVKWQKLVKMLRKQSKLLELPQEIESLWQADLMIVSVWCVHRGTWSYWLFLWQLCWCVWGCVLHPATSCSPVSLYSVPLGDRWLKKCNAMSDHIRKISFV